MLEAERQFRRVIGYAKLPALAIAVERDIARHTVTDTRAPETTATSVRDNSPRRPPPNFHGDRDILQTGPGRVSDRWRCRQRRRWLPPRGRARA